MPNSLHPIVSDGRAHKWSVGINKPLSDMLGVLYNWMYPKAWFVFDIYTCQNLSHTSFIGIKLTSIRQRIPSNRLLGYLVHFNSLRSLFMEQMQ